jgi:hypothetical protein
MTNKWTPELSQEVLVGIEAASRAQKELEQIDGAITTTNTELATAKAGMDAARAALGAAEAESTLHGGGADKPARRALLMARDEHDFLTARFEGLQARRKTAVDALVLARHRVAVSYRTWQLEQVEQFINAVYQPAMERFVSVVRMAAGVGSALDSNMLTAIGHDTVLRNPADWERNPASARRTGWQSDPLYLRLSELVALVRPHLSEEVADPAAQEDSGAAA